MTTEPSEEAASRKPFPWRTALFVSVAVNLLLIGGLAGLAASDAVRFGRGGHDRVAMRDGPQRSGFMRALSDENRAEVRRILGQSFQNTREQRAAARARREEVEALATAEVYDKDAFRAALARLREADETLAAEWHNAVADAIEKLPVEERRAAVDAFIRDRFAALGQRLDAGRRNGRDAER